MTRRAPLTALAAALAAVLAATATAAREIPPAPARFVHDEAGWLSASVERDLSRELLEFERDTSNQIVVAIFRTLGDEDLADFSQRVAEAWGIGQGERDNGILLAVFDEERLIDIEVGYGLEAVVTDAICDEIRRGILVPALRAGDREAGITDAVHALMDASRGEFEGTGRARSERDGGSPAFGFGAALLAFLFFFAAVRALRARNRARGGPFVLGPHDFGDHGRWWGGGGGGFGGGGFGGGGGGGGGFGGFSGGGGSFGGGGARGGW